MKGVDQLEGPSTYDGPHAQPPQKPNGESNVLNWVALVITLAWGVLVNHILNYKSAVTDWALPNMRTIGISKDSSNPNKSFPLWPCTTPRQRGYLADPVKVPSLWGKWGMSLYCTSWRGWGRTEFANPPSPDPQMMPTPGWSSSDGIRPFKYWSASSDCCWIELSMVHQQQRG